MAWVNVRLVNSSMIFLPRILNGVNRKHGGDVCHDPCCSMHLLHVIITMHSMTVNGTQCFASYQSA